jgi:hypothetical protein
VAGRCPHAPEPGASRSQRLVVPPLEPPRGPSTPPTPSRAGLRARGGTRPFTHARRTRQRPRPCLTRDIARRFGVYGPVGPSCPCTAGHQALGGGGLSARGTSPPAARSAVSAEPRRRPLTEEQGQRPRMSRLGLSARDWRRGACVHHLPYEAIGRRYSRGRDAWQGPVRAVASRAVASASAFQPASNQPVCASSSGCRRRRPPGRSVQRRRGCVPARVPKRAKHAEPSGTPDFRRSEARRR